MGSIIVEYFQKISIFVSPRNDGYAFMMMKKSFFVNFNQIESKSKIIDL